MSELKEFWETLKNSEIKLRDLDKLADLLNKSELKKEELSKSRDKWKERCINIFTELDKIINNCKSEKPVPFDNSKFKKLYNNLKNGKKNILQEM
jgi:hypothetical protein